MVALGRAATAHQRSGPIMNAQAPTQSNALNLRTAFIELNPETQSSNMLNCTTRPAF